MKAKPLRTYVFWILLSLGTGALSGYLSAGGMNTFQNTVLQPPLSPPSWLFPFVWTILYSMMGISATRIRLSPPSADTRRGINLFIIQLVVNFFWSLIFFQAEAYGFAFLWLALLWILVLAMILEFRKTDPPAAKLQIPYLLCLTFAAYLNLGIWYLNK